MTAARPRPPRTFAVHPTARGFGWVAFEGHLTPYDWGLVGTKADKNMTCLRKVDALIARFLPDTLVLEAFERHDSVRHDRITRLCRSIVSLAADRGVDVAIYTREQIRACFASVGAKSRHEIAQAVVRHVDALRNWLPQARKPWDSEHRRLAVFAAAALVLTHHQLGTGQLFDGLSPIT